MFYYNVIKFLINAIVCLYVAYSSSNQMNDGLLESTVPLKIVKKRKFLQPTILSINLEHEEDGEEDDDEFQQDTEISDSDR